VQTFIGIAADHKKSNEVISAKWVRTAGIYLRKRAGLGRHADEQGWLNMGVEPH
jgi:hypothetical protein